MSGLTTTTETNHDAENKIIEGGVDISVAQKNIFIL